jgi:cyclopropane fatty-acyl-phospholipid synthase-like methyltransferase
MSTRNIKSTVIAFTRESWWYLLHKIKGTSYSAYYAERMDKIIKRNPNWGLNLNKRFQLDYLIKHGLEKNSSLLDYGCGALAAGALFVDISAEVLAEGKRRLSKSNLIEKSPELYLLKSRDFSAISNRKFDVIWAQSVLTHMPPDDIENLLNDIRAHMHPQSNFFATFASGLEEKTQRNFKDNKKFFINIADSLNLDVQFPSDWKHPDDLAGVDVLAQFSLKSS